MTTPIGMPNAPTTPHKLPAHIRRRISVLASCDDRTVAKLLAGKLVMPLTRERIEGALRELGLGHLIG